jgi:hypothetical protein
MNSIVSRQYFIPAILLIIFVLSLVFYLLFPPSRTEQVLFFPEAITGNIKNEKRFVPRYDSLDESIETLIYELMLGPINVELDALFNSDADINSLLITDDKLYIDFDSSLILNHFDSTLSLKETFNVFKKSIYFNFRNLGNITITISGQMPFFPVYDQ